jgi:hypothetical protein
MSVEVAAPHHVVVSALPGVVCIVLEELFEDVFSSGMLTQVVYVEDS